MILPPATLGVLGGGQLGRYFVLAARELGYRVMVLDPDTRSAAGRIADEHLVAAYDDPDSLDRMAESCAVVTTEFESVPADALAYLARFVPVRPGAEAVATCQNRSVEKDFLKKHGFPHAPYADIRCEDDIKNVDASLFPGILKVARFGYDGKGQVRVKGRDDALAAFHQLKNEPCVLERMLSLECEISVVLTRKENGKVEYFPAAQNHHRHGVLDYSVVPARDTPGCLTVKAREIAEGIAARLDYVGTLGVEFFVVAGELHVNEIAPRPHNSGHYTLDACITNQFEQQVRALCGLPLGDASAHSAAVMVNLLGDLWYPDGACYPDDPVHAQEPDWRKLLSVPNLKLRLYGKHHARPGRKMGHFTVLGEDPEQVHKTAMAARAAIGVRDE
ncbi:MAG: 5-(carboxyamino)imidazole ribonucleotide synthase [Gallionella sp.]|nr:5-(carboxyamino)imidazole ribonucleotide synthase [Gallionella sp.]